MQDTRRLPRLVPPKVSVLDENGLIAKREGLLDLNRVSTLLRPVGVFVRFAISVRDPRSTAATSRSKLARFRPGFYSDEILYSLE